MEEQPEKQDEGDRLFVTFTAEEIGTIVVAIIRGVERKAAIRAMPRYSKEQHKVYAAFYQQLKEALGMEECVVAPLGSFLAEAK